MKLLKRTFVAVAVTLSLSIPSSVMASGFPVIDVSAIAQAVLEYKQMIIDYKNGLEQTVLSNEKLANALEQYNQMVTDYEQVLTEAEQLKSLGNLDTWLNDDVFWNELEDLSSFKLTSNLSGSADDASSYTGIDDTSQYDDTNYTKEEKVANAKYGYKKLSNTEIKTTISGVTFAKAGKAQVEKDFATGRELANETVQQKADYDALYKDLNTNDNSQSDQISALQTKLKNLGDNDTLATQQLIATQNQLMLKQLLKIELLLAKQSSNANDLANTYYNNLQKRRQNALKKLKKQY